MFSFFQLVKPTDTHLEVNGTAVQDAQKIFVSKGQRVRVRCLVTAEPKPRFVWRIPGSVFKLIFYRILLVSGIKWQASLGINSMSCSLSGTYSCMPYNALGYGSRPTITFEVLGRFFLVFWLLLSILRLIYHHHQLFSYKLNAHSTYAFKTFSISYDKKIQISIT